MKLLLHACCGPCLIEPLDRLRAGNDVTVAYANPNIHPRAEYARRRDALLAYAGDQRVAVRELAYDPEAWVRAAAASAADPPSRCHACFDLRLGRVAAEAVAHGFDAFATTLTVSPYQDRAALTHAAAGVSERFGVRYLETDFRDAYSEAVRRSSELGMYRQRYCGCLISEVEAVRQKAERKAQRKARRAASQPGA